MKSETNGEKVRRRREGSQKHRQRKRERKTRLDTRRHRRVLLGRGSNQSVTYGHTDRVTYRVACTRLKKYYTGVAHHFCWRRNFVSVKWFLVLSRDFEFLVVNREFGRRDDETKTSRTRTSQIFSLSCPVKIRHGR